MKKLLLLVAFASMIAATTGYAQKFKSVNVTPSRNYVTKEFPGIGTFDAIANSSSLDIEFTQSTDGGTQVSLYGSDNLLEYFIIENVKGTLEVKRTSVTLRINGEARLKLIVRSPKLVKVTGIGSGDIELRGKLTTPKLDIQLTGSGDIECYEIESGTLDAKTTGSGDLSFRNIKTTTLRLGSTGSGDIECGRVVCTGLQVSTTGSGDAEIDNLQAEKTTAVSSGSGDIELSGKSAEAEYTTRGSGDISARSLVSTRVVAKSSGSGDISCTATKAISARASGSGTISYAGNPAQTELSGRNIRKY